MFKIEQRSWLRLNEIWMQITAIDIDKEAYEVGLEFMKKAGVDHKINFIYCDGMEVLDKLVNDVSEKHVFL